MRTTLLRFIKKSPLHKYLTGVVFLFTAGIIGAYLVYFLLQPLYYAAFSGNYFLNVGEVTAQRQVYQDEGLAVSFCRNPRVEGIIGNINIRTFYQSDDGRFIAVYQDTLPDHIAYEETDTPCVPLKIKNDRRPNDPGKYKFCQVINFNLHGNAKVARFCSTEFEVLAGNAPK